MPASKLKRIAIVGNPNVGKSSLFNGLTRAYSLVANVPHTTMEVSRAPVRIDGKDYEVIDTPGILSLDLPAEDGLVTRAILLEEHPEVIILCLDSNNFKRSLLLAAQVMDVDVDRVALDVGLPAVDGFLELRAAEYLVRILDQLLQQHELAPLQFDARAVVAHAHA